MTANIVRDIVQMARSRRRIGQKVNYLKYRLTPRREVAGYGPLTVSIVATGRCTLACDMCPTHSRIVPKDYPYAQTGRNDITFAMFKEIIDRFPDALTVQIIGSGEPLLNRDFFRMAAYAADKGMTVKTFSNGTTIAEYCDAIVSSRLDGITVSINSHTAPEFRRMTGMDEAVYGTIVEAVKRLVGARDRRKSPIRVKLSFLVDKENCRAIPDMIRLGMSLGADHVFLCNFLASPYRGLTFTERVLEPDDAVIRGIRAARALFPRAVLKKVTFPVLVDAAAARPSCDTHFTQIRFDGDGNVSSCSMMLLNMEGQGNYRDAELWNNDFFRTMRRKFLSGMDAVPAPCRHCPDNAGVYPW